MATKKNKKMQQKQQTLLRETQPTKNIFYQDPTFLEHVYELRGRVFWVIATVIAASCVAYPFNELLLNVLTAPLGNEQLYYLTPVGGLSFIIKLCSYVGIFIALPVIVYHLYQYLEPLMGKLRKSVFYYTVFSALLAIIGMLFAYFVFLPGALHFLTGFDVGHIQAMLTVDSYLTFVITYLLGAAVLFQIPLIMSIINTIRPIPPKKLLGGERYVILAAFVIAAVLSPTPDIMNQLLFALPIIVMYQVGIFMVWLQQRKTTATQSNVQVAADTIPEEVFADLLANRRAPSSVSIERPAQTVKPITLKPVSLDGIAPPKQNLTRPTIARPAQRTLHVPQRQVDGFAPHMARA